MTRKQVAVLLSPVILIASMLPMFRSGAVWAGPVVGWYLGMTTCWAAWCAGFPLGVLGWDKVRSFFRPQRLIREAALLVFIPLAMAACFRLVTGATYEKPDLCASLGLVVSAIANGFLEETLTLAAFVMIA